MNNKRTLLSISPENSHSTPKKYSPYQKMNINNQQDVFSWSKLGDVLDDKLKDVAKKEDLTAIKYEVEELKQENCKLREDIKKLTNRLETLDRKSRTTNIVVSGLRSRTTFTAKKEFLDICNNKLNIVVNISYARMLSSGKSFVFTLDTNSQVQNILNTKEKLHGQFIYIQKDYTAVEQSTRYNLRQVGKIVSQHKKDVKVRLGEFCLFLLNLV
ncbi:uncharacterized protein LOC131998105 [Stomoxys calcitrans]|uniref:uncharacterized protein LOC131994178 n=2 Tax=Stomoxys calcitrans TaxID=35570 RepID=UPI0027E370A5|nr:uncharacterized protein LOC131994178 [Stomoxys calcitrans]XP_059216665.1 uncharacterized protein LOC131994192 [Stomoxys calcitrans]XP_059216760.1 uncharacterized protein LOC131994219 [Stomoxys calcitrans]XP_059217048.1 uncharacterized protein LOC131994313 [Stomoxys calcitrans]XP_059219494.1 uncharacterized protein LOC131995219 [Stomoxys calcitrans]XP_059220854.1 uncharacterized protein LOC131995780 [Stomoxys calcitrans]XP_059223999.1 uncharacterized protein LOC131997302 [Stomoxys calcitran